MSVYSEKNVSQAVGRLPRMATGDVSRLLDTARAKGLQRLIEACEAELSLRPIEFNAEMAERFERMAEAVAGMSLTDAIMHAFRSAVPARDYERKILRKIADEPGILFRDLERHYGKGDTSLVIGHLVYDRFGCFRHLASPGQMQSDLLLAREKSSSGVRYRLRSEAEAVLRELGII